MYLTQNDDDKERVGQETGSKECRLLMRSDATFGQGSKRARVQNRSPEYGLDPKTHNSICCFFIISLPFLSNLNGEICQQM